MSKKYEITYISDIFQIPEDRFEDFLVDFKSFYNLGKPMADLIKTIGNEVAKVEIESVIKKMVWIDDNKHDATIILNTPKKQAEVSL